MKKVIVIGGGVIGLCTGVVLAETHKYMVEIWAREFSPNTQASDFSGGMVYMPALVSQPRIGLGSIKAFTELATNSEVTGVTLTKSVILQRHKEDQTCHETLALLQKVDPAWRAATKEELRGAEYGYTGLQAVVSLPKYLPYLLSRFQKAGGTIKIHTVTDLTCSSSWANVLINCTGLGARELFGDKKVFPVCGQIVALDPSVAERCPVLYYYEDNPSGYSYYFPRPDACILGGTYDIGFENSKVDPQKSLNIRKRIDKILPELQVMSARVVKEWVGIRPVREGGFRLETEIPTAQGQCPVIHNYGHGGLGVSLSWGCALIVKDMVHNLLQ